ncbi:MAG: phage tail protein [Bacillota bacterium]
MDPFIGEIRIFAGNFAPYGWAFCNGQIMQIVQNTALFSLIGNVYGGDGKTTFALPNLSGRAPMHQGAGPGLTPRVLGETGGYTSVTLLQNEMPVHSHAVNCQATANTNDPAGAVWANTAGRGSPTPYGTPPNVAMSQQAVQPAGGSMPHNNMQPYLGLNFIIALQGIFPPRS